MRRLDTYMSPNVPDPAFTREDQRLNQSRYHSARKAPALTHADPIVVTSGNVMVSGLAGGPVFTLSGDNFSATSLGGDSGNFASLDCSPCLAGTTLGMGGSFQGLQLAGIYLPKLNARVVQSSTFTLLSENEDAS